LNKIEKTQIRVGHSPDPDDAFMFYALARDTIDTGKYEFTHELVDIETLNRRAFEADLELTALSLHAYAHLADKYAICACGASMGDKYGPMVVAREEVSLAELSDATIAIPGTLTTAYLALRMCMGVDFKYVVVPFDEILNVVEAGSFEGEEVHAGLIIHEGQLTYASQDLQLVVDLGVWWDEETGLPLPLGCNGIRKDMGAETMLEVTALLKESIVYGLENRDPALDYALGFGRGLDRSMADEFVGMYVNDWTVDFGEKGREAVALLLKRGFECGVIPELIEPEFVG
jgi:1,4-dihydroxy-6-naphthoate synthase